MAITRTRTLTHVEVYAANDSNAADDSNDKYPTINVYYTHTFDDTTDNDLPINSYEEKTLEKFVEDGGAATVYTNEDQLVQDICGAIWS